MKEQQELQMLVKGPLGSSMLMMTSMLPSAMSQGGCLTVVFQLYINTVPLMAPVITFDDHYGVLLTPNFVECFRLFMKMAFLGQ